MLFTEASVEPKWKHAAVSGSEIVRAECCRTLGGKGGLAIDLALRVPQRVLMAIRN